MDFSQRTIANIVIILGFCKNCKYFCGCECFRGKYGAYFSGIGAAGGGVEMAHVLPLGRVAGIFRENLCKSKRRSFFLLTMCFFTVPAYAVWMRAAALLSLKSNTRTILTSQLWP